MRLLLGILILSLLAAACDSTAVSTVPPITVVITAVDDTAALSDAVSQALTATAQVHIGATETVLALGGVTLTPSSTPTLPPTQSARATLATTPTPTFTPTVTPTPTFAPFLTTTPDSVAGETPGWLRVVHAWVGNRSVVPGVFDVYVNGEVVSRSLASGQQTGFQQVTPGSIEVVLRTVDPRLPLVISETTPPAFNKVVQVAPGENVSLVLGESAQGLQLLTVPESAAPLPDGTARLTLVQANPELTPVNVLMPDVGRALAYDLRLNHASGSLDVPVGANYLIDLYDVNDSTLLLGSLPPVSFGNRVSYLLVLVPPSDDGLTGMMLFSGETRTLPTEVHARLVNVAQNIGPMAVTINDSVQFYSLPIGISDPFPLSSLGNRLVTINQEESVSYFVDLPPWTDAEQKSNKILVLFDDRSVEVAGMGVIVYSQDAPRSAINSQVRLIHALPDVIPLSLEMRVIKPQSPFVEVQAGMPTFTPVPPEPFIKVTEAEFNTAAPYTPRTPSLVDVRVVLSGTRNVIAEMNKVQLVAGGAYDFITLPGNDPGSARLELIQQPRARAAEAGNPAAISEAVAATLTAIAPVITATPTRVSSPTPTRTPLPTNTPRPTNTPNFPPPSLAVDPAPPNTTRSSIVLSGQGFPASRPFSVYLDNGTDAIHTGVTTADGLISTVVNLPANVTPGLHTIRVCVAGICPGNGKEGFAVILIAGRNLTPTATLQP